MKKEVRVRIAPSPTGKLHIGTARTALFNYLFAKHESGKFILRIEDTDTSRSTKEHEKDILRSLKWLGLEYDEGPFYQMQRLDIYQIYLKRLKESGQIYPCYCTPAELEREREGQLKKGMAPKYSGRCKKLNEIEKEKLAKNIKPAIRLDVQAVVSKNKLSRLLEFTDLIRGLIKEPLENIGDFIIIKSNGVPLFFFAGVVDDLEMKISHVIRGEDHISNTFSQILLYRALGEVEPKFAHLPLILNADRTKISKRHGDITTIDGFQKLGYLPEVMINFMALLGWNPSKSSKFKVHHRSSGIPPRRESSPSKADPPQAEKLLDHAKEHEVYTIDEMIKAFRIEDVNKSASIFDENKLNYLNGYYLRQKSDQELIKILGVKQKKPDPIKVVSVVKDRIIKTSDFDGLTEFFYQEPKFKKELLIFGKSNLENTQKGLTAARDVLEELSEKDYEDVEKLNQVIVSVVESAGLSNGDVFWPIRAALSGKEASPSPVELLWVFGKEESLKRIDRALELLK